MNQQANGRTPGHNFFSIISCFKPVTRRYACMLPCCGLAGSLLAGMKAFYELVLCLLAITIRCYALAISLLAGMKALYELVERLHVTLVWFCKLVLAFFDEMTAFRQRDFSRKLFSDYSHKILNL